MGRPRSHARRKANGRPAPLRHLRLRITMRRVELARGWDGPLRGGPEPCTLVAVFDVGRAEGGTGGGMLLGRAVHRLGTVDRIPASIPLDDEILDLGLPASVAARGAPLSGSLAVLCLVLEEDDGADIASLYADVATPARFVGFDARGAVPEPVSLADLGTLPATQPPRAQPIQLLRDGRPLSPQLRHDDWIGASLIRLDVQVDGGARDTDWTIEARSEDLRNDWTMWMHVRVDV
jgi:hypothetical protein